MDGAKKFSKLNAQLCHQIMDFDPEDDICTSVEEDTGSDEDKSSLAGTEHYAQVCKSKLRAPEEISLGPKYSGSQISRHSLLEDNKYHSEDSGSIESNDAYIEDFSDSPSSIPEEIVKGHDLSDEESQGIKTQNSLKLLSRDSNHQRNRLQSKQMTLTANLKSKHGSNDQDEKKFRDKIFSERNNLSIDHSIEDQNLQKANIDGDGKIVDDESDDDESDDDESDDDESDDVESRHDFDSYNGDIKLNSQNDKELARRSELREMMKDDQKRVISTISQAAKDDVEKGKAVKEQRLRFDSLLNIRIILQKALIASNSMAAVESKELHESISQPYEAAEEAAVNLWNTLDGFRHELSKGSSNSKINHKRKHEIAITEPSSAMWERMQHKEVISINQRQSTLEKWSAKVRGTTTQPVSESFKPKTIQTSITPFIQDQLSNPEQLIRRTRMPRSCAPIQSELRMVEDPNIYDDAIFYQLLLKELVDQRKLESFNTSTLGDKDVIVQRNAFKDAKVRKVVDTRASKGRKMRFTTHEKLQNFIAPEDRSSWEQTAIDRLFGTILGQKMTLHENVQNIEENFVQPEEESLRLFRS